MSVPNSTSPRSTHSVFCPPHFGFSTLLSLVKGFSLYNHQYSLVLRPSFHRPTTMILWHCLCSQQHCIPLPLHSFHNQSPLYLRLLIRTTVCHSWEKEPLTLLITSLFLDAGFVPHLPFKWSLQHQSLLPRCLLMVSKLFWPFSINSKTNFTILEYLFVYFILLALPHFWQGYHSV